MAEDVATPDPVDRCVVERQRLDRGLDDLDVDSGLGDRLTRELDVQRERVDGDGANTVLLHESDRVPRVARADVDDELPGLRAERREELEQPVAAARGEAPLELVLELRLRGPELVELVDRDH